MCNIEKTGYTPLLTLLMKHLQFEVDNCRMQYYFQYFW